MLLTGRFMNVVLANFDVSSFCILKNQIWKLVKFEICGRMFVPYTATLLAPAPLQGFSSVLCIFLMWGL